MLLIIPLACADERLRQLGYTLDTLESQPESSEPEPVSCGEALITLDDIYRAVEADLVAQPGADRPFLRYLSLASRINDGACPDELTQYRQALGKLVNSASPLPDIVTPATLDAGRTLRIDIRDYGWDRPVEILGQNFRDGWEAVIATSPFAVEHDGPAADIIESEAQSSVPVLGVDAFIGAVVTADLYYALLGVPATLADLRGSVGLPSVLDPAENGAFRAATSVSRVAQLGGGVRVLDRYASSTGSYWEAVVMETESFLADPLHVQPEVERLVAFSLPNELVGFAVMDASGSRTGVSDRVLDTTNDDFRARSLLSCVACHAFGPIQITSVVDTGLPDSPSAEDVLAIVEADRDDYLRAVVRTGHSDRGQEQIAARAAAFAEGLDFDRAAAELFVVREALFERRDDLDVAFRALNNGLSVSRERFGILYASTLCQLHTDSENRPSASECQ
jgi:hypothetical protein